MTSDTWRVCECIEPRLVGNSSKLQELPVEGLLQIGRRESFYSIVRSNTVPRATSESLSKELQANDLDPSL